jgi:hypothetical protein
MTEKPRRPQPELSAHGKAEAARRQERLAAALRENLRKRKQQAKAKDATDPPDET